MVSRGTSSTADAYLTPVLKAYIDGFFSGFDPSLRNGEAGTRVEFMMSEYVSALFDCPLTVQKLTFDVASV